MDLLVVGAGTMGRWFARAAAGAAERVAFADVDAAAASAAADATAEAGGYGPTAVDTVASPDDRRFDAVCVAVPMGAVEDAVVSWAPAARAAILDVAGVMGPPLAAMAEHAPARERVSLHPLFAPENEPGNVAVATGESGPVSDRLLAVLADRGNDLVETTAAAHDDAMATVQAGAHAAILAYGLAAEDVPDGLQTPVSASLADLLEAVVAGDPAVYADIQATYGGADAVAAAADRLAAADAEEFAAIYGDVADRVLGGDGEARERAPDDG